MTIEVDFLYSALKSCANVSEEQKQAHRETVQKKKENQSNDRCPFCGGHLVLRTAKKGTRDGSQFLGCSNYPRCRYTRNILFGS